MDISSLQVPANGFFNLICRNAKVGCWAVDIQTKLAWWSDICYELLGIEDKNEVQNFEDFLDNKVHPEDRFGVTTAIKNHLHHHITHDKNEVRLKNKDGCYNWFEVFSEASFDEKEQIQQVFGSIMNIDERKMNEEEATKLKFIADVTEEDLNIGVYERSFETGERVWSKMVYDIFELPYGTYQSLEQAVACYIEEDRKTLMSLLEELRIKGKPFDIESQLITAKGNRIWVRAIAKPIFSTGGKVTGYRGMFQKIEHLKMRENFLIDIRNKIKEQNFFLDETSAMSHVGGWEIDMKDNTVYWSKETRKIYEVSEDYKCKLETTMNFFTDESKELMLKYFQRLLEEAKPFDLELELMTAARHKIWVRSIGKPVTDEAGKIVRVRGVIQNITEQKNKELELNSALNIINGQNDKLKDFTYIVSHNLRSHSGNLKMITEMVELETDIEVKLEWIELIKNVSASLSQTVNNLNGLVNLNIENKKRLFFRDIFVNIQKGLNYKLMNEEVEITTDFSACEWVDYVPAYLESIMLNLITNAIKYKHPERKPIISLRTAFENNKPHLKVTDNGLGIDLEMYGNRLFKMNQTFHQNSDARGIGLYITKNQVEMMGGTIEAESVVDKGTTFTVHF